MFFSIYPCKCPIKKRTFSKLPLVQGENLNLELNVENHGKGGYFL